MKVLFVLAATAFVTLTFTIGAQAQSGSKSAAQIKACGGPAKTHAQCMRVCSCLNGQRLRSPMQFLSGVDMPRCFLAFVRHFHNPSKRRPATRV